MQAFIILSIFLYSQFSIAEKVSDEDLKLISKKYPNNSQICIELKEHIDSYIVENSDEEASYPYYFLGKENNVFDFLNQLQPSSFQLKQNYLLWQEVTQYYTKSCSSESLGLGGEVLRKRSSCQLSFDIFNTYSTLLRESKINHWTVKTKSFIYLKFKQIYFNLKPQELSLPDGLIAISLLQEFQKHKIIKTNQEISSIRTYFEKEVSKMQALKAIETKRSKDNSLKEYCEIPLYNLERKIAKNLAQKVLNILKNSKVNKF